jgi:hypothetical protein
MSVVLVLPIDPHAANGRVARTTGHELRCILRHPGRATRRVALV